MAEIKHQPGMETLKICEQQVTLTIRNNLEEITRFLKDEGIIKWKEYTEIINPEAKSTLDSKALTVFLKLANKVEENDDIYTTFVDYLRKIIKSENTVRQLNGTYAEQKKRIKIKDKLVDTKLPDDHLTKSKTEESSSTHSSVAEGSGPENDQLNKTRTETAPNTPTSIVESSDPKNNSGGIKLPDEHPIKSKTERTSNTHSSFAESDKHENNQSVTRTETATDTHSSIAESSGPENDQGQHLEEDRKMQRQAKVSSNNSSALNKSGVTEDEFELARSDLSDPDIQRVKNASVIFETLGLKNKHISKFQLKDAQCISRNILKLSLQGYCTKPEELPHLIFHKIMSNDIRCRTNLYKKEKKERESDQEDDSESYSESEEDSTKCEVIPVELHPVDCLIALLLCCDDFLRRDIFTRLAKCQIAIPLILPDILSKQLIIPLWAMRSIIKEWNILGEKPPQSQDIIAFPMPIVSMIRFGRHQNITGLSKSQILNLLIDEFDNNSHFFHHNCSGGQYKQFLGQGLVDMSWYLPSDKKVCKDSVTFLNLHGDASELPKQVEFLGQISSICLVMICRENFQYTKEDKERIHSMSAKVTILNATKKKNKMIAVKFPNSEIVRIPKTVSEIYDALWKNIKQKLGHVKELSSIEKVTKNLNDQKFLLDEYSPEQQEGFKQSSYIMQNIIENMTMARDDNFPLQGKLWKSWADWEKEAYRQKNRGTKNTDSYSHEICIYQNNIRSEQLRLTRDMSPVMESFIQSLINTTDCYMLRTCFLQNLILELNRHSAKILKEKEGLYRKEKARAIQDPSASLDVKQKIEEEILQISFGLEHLLREVGQVYEASCKENANYCSQLAKAVAQLLIDGYPIELMDGDSAHVPLGWIKAVLKQAVAILGEDHKIYVISVLGLQSTGKSTMLNTIFGLQFNVSAGRHTRGAFMQLVPLDDDLKSITKCSFVLIVDTEGLRAFGYNISQIQEHNNELATFFIGLANMTIINIYGEVPGDLDDILQTSIHAFLRMNEVEIDSSCHFVHQNASPNTKSEIGRNMFSEKLNRFTKNAAKEENCEGQYKYFNDIIKYDDTTDSHFFPCLWKGDPPMAPVNIGYSETAQLLKLHIIDAICKSSQSQPVGLPISSFCISIATLWDALLKEIFVFGFRNTLEISVYNLLEIEYMKWSRKFKNAIMEWEATTDNEVSCAKSTDLSQFISKKTKDLAITITEHFHVAEKELNTYFDNNKGIISKWKQGFELKLKNQQTILKTQANQRLLHLFEAKMDVSNFEAKKNEIVEDIKLSVQSSIDGIKQEQKEFKKSLEEKKLSPAQFETLLEKKLFTEDKLKIYSTKGVTEEALVNIKDLMINHQNMITKKELDYIFFHVLTLKEVNLILKHSSSSEKKLEEEFEKIWEDLMSKVSELSPVEPDIIADMIVITIMEHVGPQGRNTRLTEILHMKPLKEYTESDLALDITASHFSIPGYYKKMVSKVKKHFHYEDAHFRKVDEITKDIFFYTKQHIHEITGRKTDFTETFIHDLLYFVDDKISGAPKVEFEIQFTHQYKHEVYVRVCGYAIPFFAKMSKAFADRNNPHLCLQQDEKPKLLRKYQDQYQQIETEEAIASTLIVCLEETIKKQVKKVSEELY